MIKKSCTLLVLAFLICKSLFAQQLAFPSAEGFGKHASGGRGGLVYVVTNLNDAGPGSLRKGILKKGPRIIVFAVSGSIVLSSKLDINHGDLSIFGQTAPAGGITIIGYPVTIKSDNVILRYLRFRMGDVNGLEGDVLGCRNTTNVIIDHCSISWGTDENASFYNNRNFTLQWSIVSEALNKSLHHKGAHGYGGIWGGVNVSFHHNLIASNNSRNPRFSGSETTLNAAREFVDFRNNVIYNWGENSIYGGENGRYNLVNNYFKPGPATPKSKLNRIISPSEPYGTFFVHGNYVQNRPDISADNWSGGVQGKITSAFRLEIPIDIENNTLTHSAHDAYSLVLQYAGCSRYREVLDDRIIRNVREGSADFENGIINSQQDVGGFIEMPIQYGPADQDADGIPDYWEVLQGLNPEQSDSNLFTLNTNYANVEVYANTILID
ncbi:MAG: hypothetical protein RLZZ241_144 [Bacteroidota bacterium]|jgi:hypothetical protein